MLFTDGESNYDPPRGIIPTLNDYLGSYPELNVSFNTYGFGYNINSNLLYDISLIKGGIFGFIPDSSMIGSVFVNSLAYIISNEVIQLNQIENMICDKLIQSLNSKNITDFNIFIQKFKEENSPNENNIKLLDDILIDCSDTTDDNNGQIYKALLEKYYQRWGQHYIRSVLSAYTNRFCLNFKDHGIQNFKTERFDKIQKAIENIFINLPPPVPTGSKFEGGYGNGGVNATRSSQAFSSTFYNPSGVCFLQNSTVCVEGGNYIMVQNVKQGMKLQTMGKLSTVICVLKTKITKGSPICRLIHDPLLGITPYHPIFYGDSENNWVFPIESDKFFEDIMLEDSYVYNYVLDSNHVVDLDDNIYAVTLNHGMTGNVIEHEYFGTDKIIKDLKKHPGWMNGYIRLDDYKFLRNSDNGRISGLVF